MNDSNVPKIGFVSLGCPKALVDSERILTQLRAEGYNVSPTYEDASLVVVNTCGFIDDAVQESLDAIGEAVAENGKVIVTGCLGVKPELIQQTHPKVLAVTGPHQTETVMHAIRRYAPISAHPFTSLVPPQGIKLTPPHYAYLKISEGCNHHCTFCIIPSMRGPLQSRPIGEVMDEAEKLVSSGVKELLVISQDTSAYGVDVKYRTGFWQGRPVKTRMTELATALAELDVWVRLHYVYPYPHVDEVIPLMADGKILPYLDMPLQHASPSILKAMRRPAGVEDQLARIQRWRQDCPELVLRSTFIVGFPGETDRDFDMLLEFLKAADLDRVGCFAYSPVEGATANALPGAVPDELKQERLARFMEVQAEISARKLHDRIDSEMMVLVDEVGEQVIGRCYADSPEIDGVVFVEDVEGDVRPGDFLQVRITEALEHDLIGEFLEFQPDYDDSL
ncbi:MAG: 30S ribosomal protein S12 methylthiotransferase RimO [Gammaproteobacteria bacterium]|nr:30S ribosomal protein S12 methylthiotransferase RimO [Gammaproteobacteria bacterium]